MVLCLLSVIMEDSANAQWVQTNGPHGGGSDVTSLAVIGTSLVAGSRDSGGVFLSTDNGTSWAAVNAGFGNDSVRALGVNGTSLFAGTYGGVFLSTNDGMSWSPVNNGLIKQNGYVPPVSAFAFSGANVFAGTGGGVFLSTNNGTSWTAVDTGLTNTDIQALAFSGPNLFAGTFSFSNSFGYTGLFLSTNSGNSWNSANSGLGVNSVFSFAVKPNGTGGTNLFAGSGNVGNGGTVFLSTNNGTSWTAANAGLGDAIVNAFAINGTNIFAGTDGGVYLSTNNGTNWISVNTGLGLPANTYVGALAFIGTNLFAGTYSNGVWRRPLSEMIPTTSVEGHSIEVPTPFSLAQNYPNPFNPSTTIQFSIPHSAHVVLRVFNTVGQEVALLVSEELGPGTYTRQWNAVRSASGVYFYRLQAGSFTETKKFILVR